MTRAAPFVVALLAFLAVVAGPAGAQVMPWWLGGAEPPERADTTLSAGWWLGGEAQAETASPVSWWLGTSNEPSPPVPVNQTLGWWLGSTAQASGETEADGSTAGPGAEAPNYATWAEVAAESEEIIGNPATTNLELERLRSRLVEWRERFLSAQNANRLRIDTIRSQISALGPAPGEGQTEAPDIAARRTALNEQLVRLQVPGISAEEAYLGADGLIREIDTVVRARQTSELLELGPSPLVPVNWPPAFAVLSRLASEVVGEVREGFSRPSLVATARDALPAMLLMLVFGLALLLRGRIWCERLAARLLSGTGRRAKRVVLALIVSLGQVVLPYLGIILIVSGLFLTGFVGPVGGIVLGALPMIGFVVLAARWLGQQVFPTREEVALLPGLSAERRAEGRLYATVLGILLGVSGLLAATIPPVGETQVAHVVLSFPVILVCGLILLRLGQLLVAAGTAAVATGDPSTRTRLLLLTGRAAIFLGLLGPVLAAIGYYMAGRFMVFPAILSLALLAFITVLQRFVADLYALATGRGDDEEEALWPVLIGFGLGLVSLPVFALIWGARVADLTEMWARAREGFAIGETRIAPTDFITFILVFIVGFLATRLVQGALRNSVLPKTGIDPGGQTALVSGTGYLGIFLAALVAITAAGIDLSSFALVAGALGVGIGFGLQNIVSNFISGIILLVERPISEGDWIEVNGRMGHVRDISVRSTRIETFDRTDVIVPNSDLISGVVTNFTRGNLTGRIILKVGAAYGSDTRKVETILREVAEAHPLVTLNPKPGVLFMGFGQDSLEFEVRAVLRDVNFSLSARSDMNHEIARRFAEEGVEIPFAQRDIWLRNPEALAAAAAPPAAAGAPDPEPAQEAETSVAQKAGAPAAPRGRKPQPQHRPRTSPALDPLLQDLPTQD